MSSNHNQVNNEPPEQAFTPERGQTPTFIVGQAEAKAEYRMNIGRSKYGTESEDVILNDPELGIFGINDGAGGAGGDPRAAALAANHSFASYYGTKGIRKMRDKGVSYDEAVSLAQGAANAMRNSVRLYGDGGSTTGTFAVYGDVDGVPSWTILQIGDSAALSFPGRSDIELEQDSSIRLTGFAGTMLERPDMRYRLTEDQSCDFDHYNRRVLSPYGNTILNAIAADTDGSKDQILVVPASEIKRLVLGSDGIFGDQPYEFLSDRSLEDAGQAATPQESADILLNAAIKDDDKSILVIELASPDTKQRRIVSSVTLVDEDPAIVESRRRQRELEVARDELIEQFISDPTSPEQQVAEAKYDNLCIEFVAGMNSDEEKDWRYSEAAMYAARYEDFEKVASGRYYFNGDGEIKRNRRQQLNELKQSLGQTATGFISRIHPLYRRGKETGSKVSEKTGTMLAAALASSITWGKGLDLQRRSADVRRALSPIGNGYQAVTLRLAERVTNLRYDKNTTDPDEFNRITERNQRGVKIALVGVMVVSVVMAGYRLKHGLGPDNGVLISTPDHDLGHGLAQEPQFGPSLPVGPTEVAGPDIIPTTPGTDGGNNGHGGPGPDTPNHTGGHENPDVVASNSLRTAEISQGDTLTGEFSDNVEEHGNVRLSIAQQTDLYNYIDANTDGGNFFAGQGKNSLLYGQEGDWRISPDHGNYRFNQHTQMLEQQWYEEHKDELNAA